MKGHFITFEGPEGSGKSSHARRVVERLRQGGLTVLTTREPGGTPTGELIREMLQHERAGEPLTDASEVLLFCASRAQLVERVIRPALERGEWVVCDRFTDSTLAYQGYGRGFDLGILRQLNGFAVAGVLPDVTLLMDVPVEAGLARVHARGADTGQGADRIEREEISFHQRMREGYLEMAAQEPERWIRIDTQPPPEVVAAAVWDGLSERVPELAVMEGA